MLTPEWVQATSKAGAPQDESAFFVKGDTEGSFGAAEVRFVWCMQQRSWRRADGRGALGPLAHQYGKLCCFVSSLDQFLVICGPRYPRLLL